MLALVPQAILDGLLIGGIYITVALGFSLAFGVMHIIDFAVGEWIMLGAFMGYYLTQWTGADALYFLPAVFGVFLAVGYWVQPIIHRAVSGRRGNPVLMGLVFTFGLMLAIRGLGLTVFGFFSHSLRSTLAAKSLFLEKGGLFLTVPAIRLAGFVYALVIMAVLYWVLKKTDFGLAVRALSQNREAAGLMGIDPRRISSWVYGIHVGVSAMTGVIIGCIFTISAQMGGEYTILAFFVVVLAGMGYLAGVPWAAFLLGLVQSFFLIFGNPSYTMLAVFAILYLILLVSPRGLFAKGV